MKALMIALAVLMCTGCSTMEATMAELDAGCVDVEVRGYLTDTRADGRGVKVPEGTELTPELIQTLCGEYVCPRVVKPYSFQGCPYRVALSAQALLPVLVALMVC